MTEAFLRQLDINDLDEMISLKSRLKLLYNSNSYPKVNCKRLDNDIVRLINEKRRRRGLVQSVKHTIEFKYLSDDIKFDVHFTDEDEWFYPESIKGHMFIVHHDTEYNHIVVYLDDAKYTTVHKQPIDISKPML